ncbi:MAG: glutathione S-transferase [Pseudomonadota bacterium]
MELLYSPPSPFARMALVCAHETGMIDQITVSRQTTTAYDTAPDVAAANPLGKIPSLTRPDGTALYDSRVICRYLDARGPAGLYPEARLWEVLTLEATATGIMDCAVAMAYEVKLRREEERSAKWVEAQWAKVERALDAVEARWMSHLHGPLDMSHIAMGCALGYLDLRHDARGWKASRPSLAAWYSKFAVRPSMVATPTDA